MYERHRRRYSFCAKGETTVDVVLIKIQRDRDIFCPVQPVPEPNTGTCTDVFPHTDECVSVCVLRSDEDALTVSAELDDSVFKKPADPPPRLGHRDRGVRVSCSSTDDACVQGALRPSEGALPVGAAGPAAPRSSRLSWKSETEDRGGGEAEGGGGEEEENKDQLTENPVSSAIMRASIRPLSPLRRHSWEPVRNSAAAESDITPSSPMKSPSGETKRAKTPLHRRSYSLEGLEVERGTLQTPCPSILSDQQERNAGRSQERGSLLSLTEEEQEGDASSISSQPSHPALSVTNSCPAMFHHQTLTKSISMVTISHRDIGVIGCPPSKRRISFSLSIPTLLPKNRRFFSIGCSSSDEEEEGGSKYDEGCCV